MGDYTPEVGRGAVADDFYDPCWPPSRKALFAWATAVVAAIVVSAVMGVLFA